MSTCSIVSSQRGLAGLGLPSQAMARFDLKNKNIQRISDLFNKDVNVKLVRTIHVLTLT